MYSAQQLNRARQLAYLHSGIALSDNKDIMIGNRLDKLKRALQQENVDTVLTAIEKGDHIEAFISAFTTNKTHFFREDFHFEDLRYRVVKQAIDNGKGLKIYCSAASTGEEPYSILMTLENSKQLYTAPYLNYSLLATDIDTNVLAHCGRGIYEWNKIEGDFPDWIKPSEYFMRRTHPEKDGEYLVKIKEALGRKVKFEQFNLMSNPYPFKSSEFDVVFCRNVLIYFNQDDQNSILKKLFATLRIGGTLYLGHSESPLALAPYVERCGQNIFIKMKDFV